MGARQAAPARALIADQVRLTEGPDGVTLACRIWRSGGAKDSILWVRVPTASAADLTVTGDPFLPPLLLLAMKERRRLTLDADVSSALRDGAQHIMEILTEDWKRETQEGFTAVDTEVRASPWVHRGTAAGAFFSLGVDSFYTILRNLDRYPAGDSRRVSHLIVVCGFDIPLEQAEFFDTVLGHTRLVADAHGLQVVPVWTNVRTILRAIDWGYTHGPAIASVGLALGRLLHTIFVPSTDSHLHLIPWGSHPALDPLWSTETLEFVHDGAEVRRADKIGALASSPLALRFLRVCWENVPRTYNCGRCQKCLQTMVDLELGGALGRAESFPAVALADEVAGLHIPSLELVYWLYTQRLARRLAAEPRLIVAIDRAVARGLRANSPLWRVATRGDAWVRHLAGRLRRRIYK